MLKKYWKKIGMLILIIACVFNVMNKLVHKLSLNKEMLQSAQYIFSQENKEKSRRVEFRVKTDAEKRIVRILKQDKT